MSAALVFPLPTAKPGVVSPDELPGFQILHAADPGFDEPDSGTHCQFCDRQIAPDSGHLLETKLPDELGGHRWLSYYCDDDCHRKACVLTLHIQDRNNRPTATIQFSRQPDDDLLLRFGDAQRLSHFATVCGQRVSICDHTGKRLFLASQKRVIYPSNPKRFWLEAGR